MTTTSKLESKDANHITIGNENENYLMKVLPKLLSRAKLLIFNLERKQPIYEV